MWKQMLSGSNGMLNVYWNHWHPLHNGLYTTLYMPTCHFVCLDIGYLDQSGWGGEDCWCQVQDIWLWVSHRIQLTGHWVGQGQDGELAVVLVSNNYCFDFMLCVSCSLMMLATSRTLKLQRSFPYPQWSYTAQVSTIMMQCTLLFQTLWVITASPIKYPKN